MYFLKDSLLEINKWKIIFPQKLKVFFWKVNKKRKLLKCLKERRKLPSNQKKNMKFYYINKGL